MSAPFLRELAEVIDHDGDARRLDGEDVTKLRAAADHVEALEREIHRRANRELQLAIDKERLIYWLLRAHSLASPSAAGVRKCLTEFHYEPGSDRALRMLELGEPGAKRPA